MQFDSRIYNQIDEHPYPLLFVTVSGAHLYGFPSPDSDYDLRGVHFLPVREMIGLDAGRETVEASAVREGLEIDLVTHDARKFFTLMLRRNGYVLEQLFSPLALRTSTEHEELKEIGRSCITRHHAHHYKGFAHTQWSLFQKQSPRRVKPLLYVYRVLLTGIHLMRTGQIEANLLHLNQDFRLPYLQHLIDRKLSSAEKSELPEADLEFHQREYLRLRQELERAFEASSLPESTSAKPRLNELLLRLRG
jgi:predicted nucleotidyltransferase